MCIDDTQHAVYHQCPYITMQGGGEEKQKTDKEPSGTVPDNTTFTLFLQISPRGQGGDPRADEFTRGKEAISQTDSRSRAINIDSQSSISRINIDSRSGPNHDSNMIGTRNGPQKALHSDSLRESGRSEASASLINLSSPVGESS